MPPKTTKTKSKITSQKKPLISIVMGSQSDWSIMKETAAIIEKFDIAFEAKIVSAHRTPERLYEFAKSAEKNGIKVVIAGAGGAAHLPGMVAALTHLPVLGVPAKSHTLNGIDSLLSIVQMPYGIPVGTVAIGEAGAKNAALFAIAILALHDKKLNERLKKFRADQADAVSIYPC